MNDYCIVLLMRYGSFDALFLGDADNHVNSNFIRTKLADDSLELLKGPHYGAKTGMTENFVHWLHPFLAVISVGENNYG